MQIKVVKRKNQFGHNDIKKMVSNECFYNEKHIKPNVPTEEIKIDVIQTIQETESDREIKLKEQQELQQIIAKAIVESDRIKKENQEKEFKNTALKGKGKALSLICLIFAIAFFIISALLVLLTISKGFVVEYTQSLSFVLIGMIFLLLRYNVIIMYKSNDIGMKLTVYSITIAVVSLVITLLDTVS